MEKFSHGLYSFMFIISSTSSHLTYIKHAFIEISKFKNNDITYVLLTESVCCCCFIFLYSFLFFFTFGVFSSAACNVGFGYTYILLLYQRKTSEILRISFYWDFEPGSAFFEGCVSKKGVFTQIVWKKNLSSSNNLKLTFNTSSSI